MMFYSFYFIGLPNHVGLVYLLCITNAYLAFFNQGCDIEKNTVVLKSGERLGAAEIGLLATVGVVLVKVLVSDYSFV